MANYALRMVFSNKEIHDILSGFANLFFVLGILLFAIYCLAPLIGGEFLLSAFIIYGSWIVYALCIKFEARRIKQIKGIKINEYFLVSIVGYASMLFWFSYPYNLIVGGLFIFGRFVLYKKQIGQKANQSNN